MGIQKSEREDAGTIAPAILECLMRERNRTAGNHGEVAGGHWLPDGRLCVDYPEEHVCYERDSLLTKRVLAWVLVHG